MGLNLRVIFHWMGRCGYGDLCASSSSIFHPTVGGFAVALTERNFSTVFFHKHRAPLIVLNRAGKSLKPHKSALKALFRP
jgi:hypothetical protein